MTYEIFGVYHKDGRRWTEQEITEYIKKHDLNMMSLPCFRDFYMDPHGDLMLSDGYTTHFLDRNEFIVKLNDVYFTQD